jgi:hypothetical protein
MVKRKFEIFIILFSIIVSIIWSSYNLKNFDKVKINFDNRYYNQFLYSDLQPTWSIANEFKKSLDSGENFFESIPAYDRFLLPSVIIGYYYHLLGNEIFEEKENGQEVIKEKNYKFGIMIFQILLYYSAVIFFSKQLESKINKHLYKLIFIFLCLEPSLLQWQSSLWSESIFLSILIFLFSLILKNSQKNLFNFLIGLLLGILFCQRGVSFLYVFPVMIYFFIIKKTLLNYLFLVLGLLMILLPLGYNNLKKTDHFYLLPSHHQLYSYYHYFGHVILADRLKIPENKAIEILQNEERNWRNINNISLDIKRDYFKNIDYRNKVFLREVIKNPIFTFKKFTKRVAVMCVISPLWVNDNFSVDKTDPEAKQNPKKYYHKHFLRNIIYSGFIYIFTFFGILKFIKKLFSKEKLSDFENFLLFNFFSVFYFIGIAGFWGNPKYFAPCMVSVIFFFSIGIEKILRDFLTKKID